MTQENGNTETRGDSLDCEQGNVSFDLLQEVKKVMDQRKALRELSEDLIAFIVVNAAKDRLVPVNRQNLDGIMESFQRRLNAVG
jgi:hypothetical protein